MDDTDAIEGLKRLGLTTYEASVFVALQKLGSGTASDVSESTDVPRSQVYGAAEDLEERGLVEIRQATPTVYRPVPLEQARARLLDQLAQTGSETFDYLDSVRGTADQREESEAIWQIDGSDAVQSRALELLEEAESHILYAAENPSLLEADILAALASAADHDMTVIVGSDSPAVVDSIPAESGIQSLLLPEERELDISAGRLLVVDSDAILLSTFSLSDASREVAFWTADTAFATLLVELAEAWYRHPFD